MICIQVGNHAYVTFEVESNMTLFIKDIWIARKFFQIVLPSEIKFKKTEKNLLFLHQLALFTIRVG